MVQVQSKASAVSGGAARLALAILIAGAAIGADASCAGAAEPGAPAAKAAAKAATGAVDWLVPPAASAVPQTEEQAEFSKKNGRPLPKPEVLQPTIDPDLKPYVVRQDLKLSGTFKGGASDVLPGIVKLWIERFTKLYPEVRISIEPPYAGSVGAKELVKERLDFAFVSRELKPDDLTDFKAKFGYNPTSIAVMGGSYRHFGFLDAVGFFVSKENPLEKISFDQLDAVLSSTQHRGGKAITAWGELGLTGEWADKPIHIYGIKPWNGFEEFIRQRVMSVGEKRGEWREGINFEKVVFPMAQLVAMDKYGIGYSGLAYIDAGVRMLPLGTNSEGPFVAPSYENVAMASYPLSRLVYFNVNKAPGKPLAPALEEFIRFVLSKDGQQAVLDQAVYLPLRAGQSQLSIHLLEP